MTEWRGLWECEAGHRLRDYALVDGIATCTEPRLPAHGGGVCGLPVHRVERRQGEPWAQLARLREAWLALDGEYQALPDKVKLDLPTRFVYGMRQIGKMVEQTEEMQP